MGNNLPLDPDSMPTLPPKGQEKPDPTRGAPGTQEHLSRAREGETLLAHLPGTALTAAKPEEPTHAAAASATSTLRTRQGIRGDVSLPSEDAPEKVVSGPASEKRYSNLGEIARGGMGAIVKLLDNDIRRPVAMKVILGGGSAGSRQAQRERVERFVEEAQVTGQLEHPNIVPVHELGLDADGKVYFTMKLVRGESLEAIIDKLADKDMECREKYPLSHLLQIFLKVCDGVAFAHSKGVIHRDLKPENVMVGKFGEVLVMDWGLAKVKGREDSAKDELVATIRSEKETGRSLAGEVMGTPSYMPPEQANGEIDRIDEKSDLFALGGILYKVLTHEAPYAGETVTNVLLRAVEGNVVSPGRRSPWLRIPRELESICLKAMAKEKGDRYPSAQDLIEDVRAFLDHRLVGAHRYGLVPRFVRFVQRHPAGSLAGGVAMLLVSIGLGVSVSLASWAREMEAEAKREASEREVATARAENEALRAERAEVRATQAEDSLEKGRRVSAVLRAAEAELGEAHRDLKRIFHSGAPPEAASKAWEKWLPRIEEFERAVGKDRASQAAWLAAKGWLRRHGGDETEAFELFAKAKRTDPDVTYGYLFEAMVWLSAYLARQPMPSIAKEAEGMTFGVMPGETGEMKRARENFEGLIRSVSAARVWGEAASGEFGAVLAGFRAMQEGRLTEAEEGLSAALQVPELLWIGSELRLARAKARYFGKRFREGLDDVEAVLREQPDNLEAYHFKGLLWTGEATALYAKRSDPREAYRKAIEAHSESLERNPDDAGAYANRGNSYTSLADVEAERGAIPRDSYGKAIEDFGRALALNPELGVAYNNRGNAYRRLGEAESARQVDPRESYRKAIEDFSRALVCKQKYPAAQSNRGDVYCRLGEVERALGLDPRDSLRRAIEDYGEALAQNPDDVATLNNRGIAFRNLGEAEGARGGESGSAYEQSLKSCEEVRKRAPDQWQACANMGIILRRTGRFEEAASVFEKALLIVKDRFPPMNQWLVEARDAAALPEWGRDLKQSDERMRLGAWAEARRLYEDGVRKAGEAGVLVTSSPPFRVSCETWKDLGVRFPGSETGDLKSSIPPPRKLFSIAFYYLACIYSRASAGQIAQRAEQKPVPAGEAAGLRDKALENLRWALGLGWSDLAQLRKDPDLEPIRELPEFKKLLEEWEEKLAKKDKKD